MKTRLQTIFPSPGWFFQASVCWLDTLFLILCYGPSYLPSSPSFIFWSLNAVLKGFKEWKQVKMRLLGNPARRDWVLRRGDLSTHGVTRMHAYVRRPDPRRTWRGGGRLQIKERFWSRTFRIQTFGAIYFGLNYRSSISTGQPAWPCATWILEPSLRALREWRSDTHTVKLGSGEVLLLLPQPPPKTWNLIIRYSMGEWLAHLSGRSLEERWLQYHPGGECHSY